MTSKLTGEIKYENGKVIMPAEPLPISISRKDWNQYVLWEFNGHAYKPVTKLAEDNLENIIDAIKKAGFTKAVKEGKRKPSSIKYAILTTGIEPFTYV